MKKNNEVTLRIKGDLENFKKKLIEKGYEEYDHFILDDTFMIPNNLKIEENISLDFSDCFIKKAEIELDKVLGRKEII